MNNALESQRLKSSDESDLMGSLQTLLDRKHAQFVSRARRYWEKNFAGKDPSDACVNVRISHNTLPSPRPTIVHRLQTV